MSWIYTRKNYDEKKGRRKTQILQAGGPTPKGSYTISIDVKRGESNQGMEMQRKRREMITRGCNGHRGRMRIRVSMPSKLH
jgi:hypothetical protein